MIDSAVSPLSILEKKEKLKKEYTHPIDLELLKKFTVPSGSLSTRYIKKDFLNLSPLWPYGFFGIVLRPAVVSDSERCGP